MRPEPIVPKPPRFFRLPLLLVLALSLAACGVACGRCSSPSETSAGTGVPPEAPSPAPSIPALLPAPRPLTFAPLRGRTSVALPTSCTLRSPIVQAALPPTTRFVAEPRSLGALIVADAQGDPPVLTGVAALTLNPAGETRDPRPLPWTTAQAMPLLARSEGGEGGGWIAAIEREAEGTHARVDLWRSGALDPVGEGDQLHAADLACVDGRCALLTTRMAKVAAAGAEIRAGALTEPAATWKRTEIIPAAGDSDARPFGLAQIASSSATSKGTVAALLERGSAVFWLVEDASEPREIARLSAMFGVLDVIAAPTPVALTYGSPVDENGCHERRPVHAGPFDHGGGSEDDEDSENSEDSADAEVDAPAPAPSAVAQGAKIRFERAGLPGVEVSVPAPPITGALRRLSSGAIAVWVAPLGCEVDRRVVYAVVLDEKGAPTSAVLPVSDAERFAVASSRDAVDLWIEREGQILWIPMTCGADTKGAPDPR